MEAGETFRRGSGAHLCVVISDPCVDRKHVAIVSLSTVRGIGSDEPTCILQAGAHSFVKHETFVAYRFARICVDADLERGISSGELQISEPVSEELLSDIRAGVAISDRVPIGVHDLLDEQGLLP